MASSFMRFLDHTQRRAIVGRTPLGRVISSLQRALPDNSQRTKIHVPGGIRTHDRSRRATVDQLLRPRGHWDRHFYYRYILSLFSFHFLYVNLCTIHHLPLYFVCPDFVVAVGETSYGTRGIVHRITHSRHYLLINIWTCSVNPLPTELTL
jgi:hypothetical protein